MNTIFDVVESIFYLSQPMDSTRNPVFKINHPLKSYGPKYKHSVAHRDVKFRKTFLEQLSRLPQRRDSQDKNDRELPFRGKE
uniref:Uncharacterized protein n=1 Tax=Romanomermis culicivorax TaxID=13658 RepID=A0A915HU98_ROMCU